MENLPETGREEQAAVSDEKGFDERMAEEETPDEKGPDGERADEKAPEEETPDGKGRSGQFFAGFLAGVGASLLCFLLFCLGWKAAQFGLLGSLGGGTKENAGAEVLTDGNTLYKLNEIQYLIENNYLEEVDGELLSAYLFKGVAAGLDDVYANYYTAEELSYVMDSSRGQYTGIGAVLREELETGKILVDEVYAGGPADTAGLLPEDVLLALDDTSLEGLELNDAVTLIKGKEDAFTLKVYRPSTEEELELSVVCGAVEVPAVSSEMAAEGIGYIRLTEFTESAVTQFTEAAEALRAEGMEKLIVDLRGNPGGLLSSVCDILDEVLPESLLVYTEDREGKRQEYYSDRKRSLDCEIAVLVDGGSASASEIFAGAIQDYQVGPIVGTTTYGKGVVQNTFTLSDGSAFKMTVEKYYTPLGQDINGNGITPDIEVETPKDTEEGDPVLEAAIEALTESGDKE